MIRARQNLSMILSIVLAALLVSWAVINIKGCVAALTWHQMSVHIWQPTTITYTISYSGATPQAMLYLKEDTSSTSDTATQSSLASLGIPVDIAHNDDNTLTLSANVTPGQATLNYRTLGATDIKISQELTPNIDTIIRHASIINTDNPANPAVSFTTFVAPGINRNIELTATVSLLDDKNNKHDLGSHIVHANEATTFDVFDADHPISSVPQSKQGKYRCLLTITGKNPEVADGQNDDINAATFAGTINTATTGTANKAGQ